MYSLIAPLLTYILVCFYTDGSLFSYNPTCISLLVKFLNNLSSNSGNREHSVHQVDHALLSPVYSSSLHIIMPTTLLDSVIFLRQLVQVISLSSALRINSSKHTTLSCSYYLLFDYSEDRQYRHYRIYFPL